MPGSHPYADDARTRRFIERYAPLYGGEDAFVDALMLPGRRALRLNRLKTTPGDRALLAGALRERGILGAPVPWWEDAWVTDSPGVGNLTEHVLGYAYVQEPASMLPPLVLDPKPGERVLDLCASPGSKTTQIAELMRDSGLLWANDKDTGRTDWLVSNLQRWGATSTLVTAADGRELLGLEGGFDRVLVDAPCSGLGAYTLTRSPIRGWDVPSSRRLANRALKILARGYALTRPGGVLVYSTCTLEPLENEGVCSRLLAETEAIPEPHGLDLPARAATAGLAEFDGDTFHPGVAEHALRVRRDGDLLHDFFVMRLRKPEDAPPVPAPDAPPGPHMRDTPHDTRPPLLSGEDERGTRELLARDHGLALPDARLYGTRKRVYVATPHVDLDHVHDRVKRVGLHAATPESGSYRLTTDGAQRFASALGNLVALEDKAAETWLLGEDLDLPGPPGFVTLRAGPLVLGTSFRNGGRVRNTLPKRARVPDGAG